jgi:hypothetical protein
LIRTRNEVAREARYYSATHEGMHKSSYWRILEGLWHKCGVPVGRALRSAHAGVTQPVSPMRTRSMCCVGCPNDIVWAWSRMVTPIYSDSDWLGELSSQSDDACWGSTWHEHSGSEGSRSTCSTVKGCPVLAISSGRVMTRSFV